jgi:transcription antitermination factor NusG
MKDSYPSVFSKPVQARPRGAGTAFPSKRMGRQLILVEAPLQFELKFNRMTMDDLKFRKGDLVQVQTGAYRGFEAEIGWIDTENTVHLYALKRGHEWLKFTASQLAKVKK